MPMTWESAPVKAQLRSSIQRLGQLQAKKDADSAITRKDIATLLQQGNVALARSKAQKLMQEDLLADLLEVSEQQIGTLLDRFSELEQGLPPSPTLLEASSSIIFAAPRVQIKELSTISGILSERLGPDVTSSAVDNRDGYVSLAVLRAISRRPPNAAQLDSYLERIAKSYRVSWTPGPQRQDLVNPLSEILDPSTALPIDITRLRHLCTQGIPDEPGWLRARIWKLFLNVLPVDKSAWRTEITKQRDAYYDLIRRLLKPFQDLSAPTQPPLGPDKTLLEVYNHLARIPVELFGQLDSEPEDFSVCPLHQNANENIRVSFSNCLDTRLQSLRRLNESDQKNFSVSTTPAIRLEAEPNMTPAISLTAPHAHSNDNRPTTLLSSKSVTLGTASQKHASALLRLLYLHASINPGNLSPYVPSLLVPLYSALTQEVEPEDLAHVEADSFWLFEAFVAEFAELEDGESSNIWMKRLDETLKRVDAEFSEQLNIMGLDPALPHYSLRWLSSLLAHTLPLPAVYPVWDVVLSRPGRERGKHPRLDSLIDICAAMLIAAKPLLLRGRGGTSRSPGLWDSDPVHLSAQPGDGFFEGLSILQVYPIDSLGGIEAILQRSIELSQKQPPQQSDGAAQRGQLGLGARIKVTMWKGFTNQIDSPERSDDDEGTSSEEDETDDGDGDETETPSKDDQTNSLTSRIANSVWRGITNQSSMEAPPSPVYVPSPGRSRPATPPVTSEIPQDQPVSPATSSKSNEDSNSAPTNLWAYTEKLKDSDTMATFAKLSSNWRAKAMMATWGRPKASEPPPPPPVLEVRSAMTSPVQRSVEPDFRRSSLPVYDHTGALYTPPPRPSVFRNPRDSFIPTKAPVLSFSPTGTSDKEDVPQNETSGGGGLLEKTRHLQSSLLSLTRTPSPRPPPPAPKTAPRPLLLNSSSLITSQQSGRSRVAPLHDGEDWADVMKLRNSHLHRDSMSSVSSLSPSDAIHRSLKSTRSDYDSDVGTSRIVPLNRRSVSPMALVSKSHHSRPPSSTSTASSEQGSPAPSTPARENIPERQDSVNVASPKDDDSTPNNQTDAPILLEHPSIARKSYRRKPQPAVSPTGDTSDSSVADVASRAARLRSKRYPPRLSNLHIENTTQSEDIKATSPSNLSVPWPTEDQETAATPRASAFDPEDLPVSPAKSPKTKEDRTRKVSTNSRTRKVSSSNRETARRSRDSAAEDGDDEGYDDLLSAYESEANSLA